ncbi:putative membrane protein YfcA [Pseudorhizobium tarimense]|uniref:Probable membrane transporter protein n=1 Tax=Pseudorhizobium tarimense TaxID=1079109 RepID=A0ABV2H6B7_9HYPH|nr:TSUP family transporter [Pseudorhizobium tarimense]MCJ8519096.1 TSUP family transporter [Pseudorhizobium tarimense]
MHEPHIPQRLGALLPGSVFGLGLGLSGMMNLTRVQGFLDLFAIMVAMFCTTEPSGGGRDSLLVAAVGSGVLVGFMLGLLDGGGSIVATPLLLHLVGVAQPHVTTIGTGALAASVDALTNFSPMQMKGNVWWCCSLVFVTLGTAGAFAGSIDAAGVALIAGAASGFFGIGGGFLIVPRSILAAGMPTLNAVGTSLMAVTAFGLATAIKCAASVSSTGGSLPSPLEVAGLAVGLLLAARVAPYKGLLNRLFALLAFVVATYVLCRRSSAL